MHILTTKLYTPPHRSKLVLRPRLIERLNGSLQRKLTLISAPAGFGKTTLISEWVADCGKPVAWLSLDEGDNDPTRFLTYIVSALQMIAPNIGEEVLGMFQAPQPPPIESILTILLNEIATIPDHFVLVLDDYHLIDTKTVDDTLTFLLEHLPPQMHLVITTREDPPLPLARLRVRNQLTELRVADLRFTIDEVSGFLNQVMGLNLSIDDISALESRTEGWIAGLQLAAISMQGHKDITNFIKSFTGSHNFVMDYLVEEVLHQQPENVQNFLLQTSILDRLSGSLCDAVLQESSVSGQEALEYLTHANLFIIPLDNERHWYRYHHLFANLLKQRLQQNNQSQANIEELHLRASIWYEENGLDIDAFHHATISNNIERAIRLIEGNGMPLLFRGAVTPVLNWLESLPTTILNNNPSLWVINASALLISGKLTGVEDKLQAAESALQHTALDDQAKDTLGHIAAIRATIAISQHKIDTIITQSHRALELLHPENLAVRTSTSWTLGYAYLLQGNRAKARQAYTEAITASQRIGHVIITTVSTIGLGNVQEVENQLHLAAESYQSVLQLTDDRPLLISCEAHLGLARVLYEWNDLEGAHYHAQQGVKLTQHVENIDTFVGCKVLLARIKLIEDDITSALKHLDQANQSVQQHNFSYRALEVISAKVLALLQQGNIEKASELAETHDIPLCQARVHLAQGNTVTAHAILDPLHRKMVVKGWDDQRLKILILQALTYQAEGNINKAVKTLGDALLLAEQGGFIRHFVDEGVPMANLLREAITQKVMPDYSRQLLDYFEDIDTTKEDQPDLSVSLATLPITEPLTPREREVFKLVIEGFSNPEIANQLVIAVTTVKTHLKNIYGKLHVANRLQAIIRFKDFNLF